MPMWRSRWIDGSATFTIVLSSMIMKRPNETAPSVHHFLFSSAKILARTPPPGTKARVRGLRLARSLLGQGARAVLAGGDRGHGARVLTALGRGRRSLARP